MIVVTITFTGYKLLHMIKAHRKPTLYFFVLRYILNKLNQSQLANVHRYLSVIICVFQLILHLFLMVHLTPPTTRAPRSMFGVAQLLHLYRVELRVLLTLGSQVSVTPIPHSTATSQKTCYRLDIYWTQPSFHFFSEVRITLFFLQWHNTVEFSLIMRCCFSVFNFA